MCWVGLPPAADSEEGGVLSEGQPRLFSFVDVVRREKGAVVNINTTSGAQGGRGSAPRMEPFLGGVPPDFGGDSLGSGFIISKDGLILTSDHVVTGIDPIRVHLSDGRTFAAKVANRDAKTDIALLKIDSDTDLPVARLGDSDRLLVGDWVVAIGNPFGLEQSVTVGIVSAKGRAIGAGPYDDYIQTDASINPGNSGGPLFDMGGTVVGMNTAISTSGQGIGFAIPINQVMRIVTQLQEKGRVVRGWLGVMIQQISNEQSRAFGLRTPDGALVSDVIAESPAERAGLTKGDLIVEYNSQAVTRMRELPTLVADTPVGVEVPVRVIRDGKSLIFSVQIEEMKENF